MTLCHRKHVQENSRHVFLRDFHDFLNHEFVLLPQVILVQVHQWYEIYITSSAFMLFLLRSLLFLKIMFYWSKSRALNTYSGPCLPAGSAPMYMILCSAFTWSPQCNWKCWGIVLRHREALLVFSASEELMWPPWLEGISGHVQRSSETPCRFNQSAIHNAT